MWGRIDCGFDSHYSEGGIEFHKQKTQESFSCSYESINPEVLAAKGLYFEWVKYIVNFGDNCSMTFVTDSLEKGRWVADAMVSLKSSARDIMQPKPHSRKLRGSIENGQ